MSDVIELNLNIIMAGIGGTTEFFGLDVSLERLRVVQLRGSPPIKSFWRWGEVALSADAAVGESSEGIRQFGEKTKEVLEMANIETKNVVAAIPINHVRTQIIDLDDLKNRDINNAVQLNSQTYGRGRSENFKIDWVNLGRRDPAVAKIEVLVCSVTNKYVEHRLDVLENAGLNVIGFEPRVLAVTRAVSDPGMKGAQMIVDFDNNEASLTISLNGFPRLISRSATSFQTTVRAVNDQVESNPEEARKYTFRFGFDPSKKEGRVRQTLINTLSRLEQDISQSIKWFHNRYPEEKVESITMTGVGAQINQIDQYLTSATGITTEIGNSWRNVSYDQEQGQQLLSQSHLFAGAIGLAAREE